MKQQDSDPSPFVTASLVESPERKTGNGCLFAIVIVGVGGLFLIALVAFASLAWLATSDSIVKRRSKITVLQELREEAAQDIESCKTAMSQATIPEDHPDYDEIVKFVDNLQSVLDDTANPELKQLVDYDRSLDELIQRADSLADNALLRHLMRGSLQEQIIGPTPFFAYDIIRIENEGPDRRVYLSYNAGYSAPEPHIWWLSNNGGFKIYDWSQLELGLRSSAENAALYDASDAESRGYNKYADVCYEYLATEENDVSFFEENRLIKKLLTECEQFSGPVALRSSVTLVTARRWQHAGENERALALLEKIATPNFVPGVHRLTGDIQFDRGDFHDAVKSYRKFIELLGPTPHAQTQLAACYREMGEADLERKALQVLTRSISEQNFDAIVQLVELNDEPQNLELFSQIDGLPCRDAAYLYLVRRFGGSVYFADRFELIREHLQKTSPQSEAAVLANIYSTPDIETSVAALKWFDENSDEDPDDAGWRYSFWLDLDESQMVEVLESSASLEEDFETICEVSDYEGTISDEVMLAVCQMVLRSQPNNFKAHYQCGVIHQYQQQFKLAIDSLRKSLEAMPESHDDESYVRSQLMSAIYESGDHSAALDLATDAGSANQLLAIKIENDDFLDFEKPLERLDGDSDDFKFYQALLNHHQGDTDAAVGALADLLNAAEENEENDYRAYSYQNKLVAFCEQQNAKIRAFALVPTDAMFALVSRRLIQEFDWPTCELLLQAEASAGKKLQRVQLRQHIDWEQGKYGQVVEQANAVLELAKTEYLSVELDRLVRAALRIGKLNKAMQFAEAAAELANRQDLIALVALRQQDAERAVRQLPRLTQYEKEKFYTDADLMHFAWREVIPPSQQPMRSLSYHSAGPRQFGLRMLFSEPPAYSQEQLQKAFATILGDDVRVERVVSQGTSRTTWVVKFHQSQILISQDSIDGVRASEPCEIESLKEAIRASSAQVRVVGLANAPTTAQTDHEILVKTIECLANEHLRAVENAISWLTAEDFFRGMEQAESASSRLFGSGEFEGVTFYLNDEDAPQREPHDRPFFNELVLALKRFDLSTDADKELAVQFTTESNGPERNNALVKRLHRSEYGDVTIHATILDDSKLDPSIRKDDRVVLSLYQIDSFDLQTSGQTLKLDRDQN